MMGEYELELDSSVNFAFDLLKAYEVEEKPEEKESLRLRVVALMAEGCEFEQIAYGLKENSLL